MTLTKSNINFLKIFTCPLTCRRKFDSVMALNVHLKIIHHVDYRIYLNEKGRALSRKIKLAQPVLISLKS